MRIFQNLISNSNTSILVLLADPEMVFKYFKFSIKFINTKLNLKNDTFFIVDMSLVEP